jgi:excinuclease UvrABC nuclease subunit
VSETPTPFGPIRSRRLAQRAARALDGLRGVGFEGDELAAALPPLRAKLRRLARDQRFEDAARLRDRLAALEEVVERLGELERLRELRLCLLVPAADDRFRRAFFVSRGRIVAERTFLPGEGGRVELEAGLAAAARAEPSAAPEDLDELLLVGLVLRTPPPELQVIPLDALAARAA